MDQYVSWRKEMTSACAAAPLTQTAACHNLDPGFGGYHDDFYTDPTIKAWYKAWVNHLVTRQNVHSQVLYRDDPTIFAWELANEPRCQGSGAFGTSKNCTLNYAVYGKDPVAWKITGWVEEVSGYIKSIDANHMVGTGDEGYFCER